MTKLDPPQTPNDLSAFWMPFTANRHFKNEPRLLIAAQGVHYTANDGRQILDGTAGLWCCNAGHGRTEIINAIHQQLQTLDFAPSFQMGHPVVFQLANRLCALAPTGFEHAFFTNSGSESVETALKMALAYHQACGNAGKVRLIGRERGYHGVNFGGISVGGMVNNRKAFGTLLSGVDHLPHTHNLEKNAFTRGQPDYGHECADALEQIIALHGAETIAAVIVEPVAGSTGVLLPPKGYLQKLRAITQKHNILLIFDEVITGFGRLGTNFAADYFDVMPDMITCAKGLTNGIIPMGAVLTTADIYNAFMSGPAHAIEFFHGYTYSGNPVASAAGLATLKLYEHEHLFENAAHLAPYWQDALHSLHGTSSHIIDIRNLGLIGAIELAPIPNAPTKRAFDAFVHCFEQGLLIRTTGDIIALSPPCIFATHHIDQLIDILGNVLKQLD